MDTASLASRPIAPASCENLSKGFFWGAIKLSIGFEVKKDFGEKAPDGNFPPSIAAGEKDAAEALHDGAEDDLLLLLDDGDAFVGRLADFSGEALRAEAAFPADFALRADVAGFAAFAAFGVFAAAFFAFFTKEAFPEGAAGLAAAGRSEAEVADAGAAAGRIEGDKASAGRAAEAGVRRMEVVDPPNPGVAVAGATDGFALWGAAAEEDPAFCGDGNLVSDMAFPFRY